MPELKIHFLDVGQGDSTLIEFPNGEMALVDMGSTKNKNLSLTGTYDFFETVIGLPTPARIKYLILTHPDVDHYNMLGDFITKFQVSFDHIWVGGNDLKDYFGNNNVNIKCPGCKKIIGTVNKQNCLRNNRPGSFKIGATTYTCKKRGCGKKKTVSITHILNSFEKWFYNRWDAGDLTTFPNNYTPHNPPHYVTEGGAEMQILAANIPHHFSPPNTASIVLRLWYGNRSAILSADATYVTEKAIVENLDNNQLKANILKLGHHGSARTSVSKEWIEALEPEQIFLSADRTGEADPDTGLRTGFGLPAQAAIDTAIQYGSLQNDFPEHTYAAYNSDQYFGKNRSFNSFNRDAPAADQLQHQTFASLVASGTAVPDNCYYEVKTTHRIYTTVCKLDYPPNRLDCADIGVRYDVTIASNGTITISSSGDGELTDVSFFDPGEIYLTPL